MDRRIGEGHQLIEHGELQFELDTVDHRFQRRFDFVIIDVFKGEEDHVHANDDQINPDQLHHDAAGAPVIDWPQKLDGRVDVDARDDEFLDTEGGHLDPLHHIEHADPSAGSIGVRVRIGAVRQDGGGNVEADGVHNDHDEDAAQHFVLSNHQVQA